jgi:hypothetical protein
LDYLLRKKENMKKRIRLTESDLHRIVKEAINEIDQYQTGRVDARNIVRGKGMENYPYDVDDDYYNGLFDQLKAMMYQYIKDNGLERFCDQLSDICALHAGNKEFLNDLALAFNYGDR